LSAGGRLPWRDLAALARRSAGLPAFLRRPLDPALVVEAVGERVRRRGAAFLAAAERLIYGVPESPLRRLLCGRAARPATCGTWCRRTAWRARWSGCAPRACG